MENLQEWKTKTLLLGAGLGLVAGLVAAFIVIQNADERNDKPQLNAGDGVKVGLGVLGVLRLIADIGKK
jgi:H+/Cl- antiporter ClcA